MRSKRRAKQPMNRQKKNSAAKEHEEESQLTPRPPSTAAKHCPCGEAGAACVMRALASSSTCVHEATSATASLWAAHCLNTHTRGLFVLSQSGGGQAVCSGGDHYHARFSNARLTFAALSRPTSLDSPAVYWIEAPQLALLHTPHQYPDGNAFDVSIALVETQRREVAKSVYDLASFDLAAWLRISSCSWEFVVRKAPLAVAASSFNVRPRSSTEARCGALPAAASAVGYVALQPPERTCNGGLDCDGDAERLLVNTSNEQRYRQRERKGHRHVLKPLGCRFHLYEEAEITDCLRGRKLLNIGSDIAVDFSRGFGRLNTSLQAWTRHRPGSAAEQRLPFRKRKPSVADWSYQFERTGGFNGRGPDVMAGQSLFGQASVGTQFLQHPTHYGLANLLEPESFVAGANASGRVGWKRVEQYERFMCSHDIVVLESGLADFAFAFNKHVTFSDNRVRPACAGRTAAECEAALAPALQGEDWRRFPMAAYKRRLRLVLSMWQRCKRAKPHFRGVFRLAPAPRNRQRPSDCEKAQWGFSVYAHHMLAVNNAARALVQAAGFEAFEGFGLTLHAPPAWFDEAKYGVRHKIHEAEALSDMTTQALLSQLCAR